VVYNMPFLSERRYEYESTHNYSGMIGFGCRTYWSGRTRRGFAMTSTERAQAELPTQCSVGGCGPSAWEGTSITLHNSPTSHSHTRSGTYARPTYNSCISAWSIIITHTHLLPIYCLKVVGMAEDGRSAFQH